jgi:hypothetical protein
MFVDSSVASLVATLIMLFEMLFGGLLLNKTSLPPSLSFLPSLSFFNAAFEALIVNEVNGLVLYENKFGLMVDVPGSVVLDLFGFDALGYWRDVGMLGVWFVGAVGVGGGWLWWFVREKK